MYKKIADGKKCDMKLTEKSNLISIFVLDKEHDNVTLEFTDRVDGETHWEFRVQGLASVISCDKLDNYLIGNSKIFHFTFCLN